MSPGPLLSITGVVAEVEASRTEVLHGIDFGVDTGQVVAVMGPNGSGKSTLGHVLMGRPGYRVTAGQITLGDRDLLAMATSDRAKAGLFLAHQYPIEVTGVPLSRALNVAVAARGAAGARIAARGIVETPISEPGGAVAVLRAELAGVGLDERFADRPLNVDLSGGEKKRNEVLQLAVLRPRLAVLDEIDSGLDVDGLETVASRIAQGVREWGMGVLAITHYSRLLDYLVPDRVHVLAYGRIVDSGGPELARRLEETGYSAYPEPPR